MLPGKCLASVAYGTAAMFLLVVAVFGAPPTLSEAQCESSFVEQLLLEEPGEARSAALNIALDCNHGVNSAILGQVAVELAIEVSQRTGDPLATALATLKYLERADSEFKHSERQYWKSVRLTRLQLLETVSDLRGSRAPLDEARVLLDELRTLISKGVDDIDVLERTVWIESALRLWREPKAWELAMAAIDTALRSSALADEMLRTDLLAQKAVLLGLGPLDRLPRLDELTTGIAAHDQAIANYERLDAPEKAANERINLATLLIKVGNVAALNRATQLALQVAEDTKDPVTKGTALLTLGNAYFQDTTQDALSSNEKAIQTYRQALEVLSEDQSARVKAEFNLILALSSSPVNTEEYLLEAEQRARILVEKQMDFGGARAKQLLGTVILSRARIEPELLQEAEDAVADAAAEQDKLEVSHRLGLLGDIAELAQLKLTEGSATFAEVEAAYQRAIEFADANFEWQKWAAYQNNLGNLYAGQRQTDLIPLARKAYHAALSVRTAETFPTEHVDTVTNLASLAFSEGQWREAADLYMKVLSKHLDFFQSMNGPIREEAIESSKRRFERAAYALAREGKLWEALSVVEMGRARTMKERLGEGLENAGYASALQWRPSLPPLGVLVLVPVITTKGTMVLGYMDTPNGIKIEVLFLEGFSAEDVLAHVSGDSGWLESYETATDVTTASGKIGLQIVRNLPSGIDAVDKWLGTAFVAPILDWSKYQFQIPFDRIVLSVQGELAILPIHSAILPSGKRLITDYEVSYLPSLVFLVGSALPERPDLLVAISNPSSDADLPVSKLEAEVAVSLWKGASEDIAPTEVTPARFMSAFQSAGTLLFVGHGKYYPGNPLSSYLMMTGGEQLSVLQIQAAQSRRAPRLVILSACETGIVGVRTASNEYEGLAGAFLALGADGVIASLWPVNEFATMLMMERFYEELSQGVRPTRALADAQNWIANAPASELRTIVETRYMPLAMHDTPARSSLANFRAYLVSSGELRVFKSPYYWAGLIYTGSITS